MSSDWLVTDEGRCEVCEIPDNWEWTVKPYRLYRFLTDLEDILEIEGDRQRLQAIRPLVRRLLTSSDWLQGEYLVPDPQTGWSVLMLYDEIDFPLTVQTVVWLPGKVSPIHNHATWGVVALISGEEKNTFWQRTGDQDLPNSVKLTEEKVLVPGDIISFTSEAIHSVEALGDEPTISLNIYGKTDYQRRFEFDQKLHSARNF